MKQIDYLIITFFVFIIMIAAISNLSLFIVLTLIIGFGLYLRFSKSKNAERIRKVLK